MRSRNFLTLVALAAVATACQRSRPAADDALKNDLALAAQAQAFNPAQFSPDEGNNAAQSQYAPYAPRNVQPSAQRPVYRQTSSPRRSSSSGSRRSSGGGYYPAPAPAPRQPVVHTNTKRDAIIGATAGAILGASTSRDRMKGGILGAAAGGVIGAIIGNKVDVTKY